jgi:hypothetical protein
MFFQQPVKIAVIFILGDEHDEYHRDLHQLLFLSLCFLRVSKIGCRQNVALGHRTLYTPRESQSQSLQKKSLQMSLEGEVKPVSLDPTK